MPDRFLTFDEVQQLLEIPADELQQLLDEQGVDTVVEGGVTRFSESDVLTLTPTNQWDEEPASPEPSTLQPGLPTGQTCETCFTQPTPPQDSEEPSGFRGAMKQEEDYGFVFLVDEAQEAAIEGEAYDGELPTEVVDVPEQISEDELMSPTDLSSEQKEALELFSEMDMSRVSEMGRKVVESTGMPDVLETPELTVEPVEADVSAFEAEPPVEVLPRGSAREEPIALETPELTVEPVLSESVEPVAPEPVSEPIAEEIVEPAVEQKKGEFEFITDEAVASIASSEISDELAEKLGQEIEVSDTYELSQANPETEVTEHAGMATDEELEDRTEQSEPEPEAETVEPTPEPVPEEIVVGPVEPLLEKTEVPEVSEDIEIPAFEEPEPVLGAETAPAVPVESLPDETDKLTPTTLSEAEAGELFDEIEREMEPKTVGETVAPADQASPVDETEPDQVPVMSGASREDQEQERIEPEEEEVVTEDQNKEPEKQEPEKQEPEKQEPEEDAFEVYDLEEETEAAPVVPEPVKAEEEEEVIDLEEVSPESVDEMEAIEKSVEEEMADIFGETPEASAPVLAAVGAEVDDFDLSIFKEGDETTEDVAALEEVDLSAVTMSSQTTELSEVEALPSAGPSRIDAITAPKGPSTLPMTLAIIVSFIALLAAGMILVALSLSKSPWG